MVYKKGKGKKVASRGLYSTAAWWLIVLSPLEGSLLHLQRRERPLPAKEGSLTHEFCQGPVI
jgi:hypothetical protein